MRIRFDKMILARALIAGAACLTLAHSATAQGLTMADLRKLGVLADAGQVDSGGLSRSGETTSLRALYGNAGLRDYSLTSNARSERVELSLSSQDVRTSLAPLAAFGMRQDVLGLKVRVAGPTGEQESPLPQIAIGTLVRRTRNVGEIGGMDLGGFELRSENNVDYFVSASKSFLNRSLQVNTTLRATRAGQSSLLGFGPSGDSYQAMLETSATWSISRKLLVGADFRLSPNSVGLDKDKAYTDLFVAYFPTKNLALTLAYASLGDIAMFSPKRQSGAYMSLQLGF